MYIILLDFLLSNLKGNFLIGFGYQLIRDLILDYNPKPGFLANHYSYHNTRLSKLNSEFRHQNQFLFQN